MNEQEEANRMERFYGLIDRLKIHSEWKYPNRPWTNDTYYHIAYEWIGKEKELEELVLKHEKAMAATKN